MLMKLFKNTRNQLNSCEIHLEFHLTTNDDLLCTSMIFADKRKRKPLIGPSVITMPIKETLKMTK